MQRRKNFIKRLLWLGLVTALTFNSSARASESELRGVWLAWAGANVPSKEKIASLMEEFAAHHINIVYVDVWRFGYPYFRSQVFYDLTGLWTDPNLDQGRDVLAEMIAEGHRVGLEVDAWFEAGFAACPDNNDDIFAVRPEWFAKKQNGSLDFYADGGIRYRWLSHCNRQAQQFLIDLCTEVVEKYDIDGIEFDRVRYPDLDCGYDSATVALYRAENNGLNPPTNIYNAGWIRWRADKLTAFVADLYQAIKNVNPNIAQSNAPLWYGYSQFCQDWPAWINQGFLDVVVPQIYYASHAEFLNRLDQELPKVKDKSKFFPGISTVANTVPTPEADLIAMIESTRKRGLSGHVIWYSENLRKYLATLKSTVYQNPAQIPYRPENWRQPAIIVNEDDAGVLKSSGWTPYTTISGFKGGCTYVKKSSLEWLEYYADIPREGWYELYAFNIYHWNATDRAPYQVFHASSVDTIYMNQNLSGLARWQKIGDFKLNPGAGQKILRLTNEKIGDRILFADAIMILNTNRPEKFLTGIKKSPDWQAPPQEFQLNQNFPNPFNAATRIAYSLPSAQQVTLKIFDILGQEVDTLFNCRQEPGEHSFVFKADGLPGGVYFFRLQAGEFTETRKMVLIR